MKKMIKKYRAFAFLISIGFIISSFMLSADNKPSLHYLVRRPEIQSERPPLLILLHGVGGNEADMFSYAAQLPGKYRVVAVRGPLTLGQNSYAWFQVDFTTGRPVINAEQAEQARKTIIQFIDDLKKVEDFDEQQVRLMGFSQGGIMSYSVALTAPEKIQGIAVMSGRLLPEVKPLIASKQRLSGLDIFVAHGTNDPVLQYQYAADATSYLKTKGLSPQLKTYQEGHYISPAMLQDVIGWLNKGD